MRTALSTLRVFALLMAGVTALMSSALLRAACPAPERGRAAVLDAALAGDASRLGALIDTDALVARIVRGLPAEDEFRRTMPGIVEQQRTLLAERFLAGLRNFGKSVVAQVSSRRDTAVLRRQGATFGEGIDYIVFELGPEGCVVDWGSLQLGTRLFGMIRQAYLLSRDDTSLLATLFGIRQYDAQQEQQMRALLVGLRNQDSAAAIAALDGMKDLARESFELSMLRAGLMSVDAPGYRDALEDIAQRFGDDQRTQFMLIDHHLLQEDYAAALRSVEAIQMQVGPDEENEFLRAVCLQLLERPDEAVAAMRRMVEMAPSRAETHEMLTNQLVALGRHADAVDAMAAAALRGFEFDPAAMRADPAYAEFLDSPEYADFRAHQADD